MRGRSSFAINRQVAQDVREGLHLTQCNNCLGTGKVRTRTLRGGGWESKSVRCKRCGGTGEPTENKA